MTQHAYSEALATEIAMLCVETVRNEHGGERLYVPALSKLSRDAAIRSELRTGNAAEVAARWNLSERRVYQIARRRG